MRVTGTDRWDEVSAHTHSSYWSDVFADFVLFFDMSGLHYVILVRTIIHQNYTEAIASFAHLIKTRRKAVLFSFNKGWLVIWEVKVFNNSSFNAMNKAWFSSCDFRFVNNQRFWQPIHCKIYHISSDFSKNTIVSNLIASDLWIIEDFDDPYTVKFVTIQVNFQKNTIVSNLIASNLWIIKDFDDPYTAKFVTIQAFFQKIRLSAI